MTKASDNVFPKLIGSEGAAPGTPASATAILYVKSDGLWYSKDDAGVETLVSGGSASGIAATIVDVKGDIIAATAADTVARLAAGANGTILMAASGESTGLKYQFPMRFKISTGSDVSSVSFADTDLLFPVLTSTSYVFEFHLYCFTNAASVGIRLAINGPAGATGRWGAYVPTSASSATSTTVGIGQNATLDSVLVGTTTGPGASGVYAIVTGSMTIAGTAGNLVLRHASETATQSVIEAGSWGMLGTL